MGSEIDPTWTFPVRAQLIARQGCDKYCWSDVKLLELLAGGHHVLSEGTTIAVASLNTEPDIPDGESILILKTFFGERNRWQLARSENQPAIHLLSTLRGLTPGQCTEMGGRIEGDYDKGCSDKEVSLGSVRFMMCPCSCCAAAKEEAPAVSLREIPEPKRDAYKNVQTISEWKNPYLSVDEKGVKFLHRSRVPVRKVIEKLIKLPRAAWPYGRVVVLADRSNSKFFPNLEKVLVDTKWILRELEKNGVAVELWPAPK